MIKKFAMLLGGMFFTVAVYAAASQLRPGHPDTYTVRKGDTLWAISAKFLSKPWLWPEIWQANPQVGNPHLIYPGDVLNLSLDGTNTPRIGLEPRVRPEGEPISAIPLANLRTFLKELRVMSADSVKRAPYLVGFEENRLRAAPGNKMYARKLDSAQPGQRWAIVRPTQRFRQHEGQGHVDELTRPGQGSFVADELDDDVTAYPSPWMEDTIHDTHWGTGQDRGVEVSVIGTAEVIATKGDVASLVLVDSTLEVRKGDRLMPVDDKPYDPYFYPHAPKSMPADPRVIAFSDAKNAVGAMQVVAISAGSADGVDNGTTFTIMAQGDSIADDVGGNTYRRDSSPSVQLPDEFAGHLMVFRTFDHVSYALVMDSLRPVHRGDRLSLPE